MRERKTTTPATEKKRSTKTAKSLTAAEVEEKLFEDPYEVISKRPEKVCSVEDHKRKKNCKGNPWCCFGLGEFKEGIWAKEPTIYRRLGVDLTKRLRKAIATHGDKADSPNPSSYGGLKNLGATCYLNTILQTMFHNVLFRDFIFSLTHQSCSDHSVQQLIEQLQYIFYSLQSHTCLVIDPKPFIDITGVNSYIQQDPQEFQNLLLTKLESLRSGATSSSSTNTSSTFESIKWMFSGKERHTISCLICHQARTQDLDFNELAVSVEKDGPLEEALQGVFFSSEILDEDNKLECTHCHKKTRSERTIEIIQFPPVLCLHLLRYQYDKKTYNKIKMRYAVMYPEVLKIPPIPAGKSKGKRSKASIDNDQEGMVEYVLVSVIFHLGKSAHGGHYICDVYDWERSIWIHCDDEKITTNVTGSKLFTDQVSEVGDDVEGKEAGDKKGKRTAAKKKGGSNSGRKKRRLNPTRDELMEMSSTEELCENGSEDEEYESAAMKTPKRKVTRASTAVKESSMPKQSNVIDLDDSNDEVIEIEDNEVEDHKESSTTLPTQKVLPTSAAFSRPRDAYMLYYVQREVLANAKMLKREILKNSEVQESVKAQSIAFEKEVQDYLQARSELEKEIENRKFLVETLLRSELEKESILPSPKDPHFHLVPMEWLKKWLIGDETTFPTWSKRKLTDKSSEVEIMDVDSNVVDGIDLDNTKETAEAVPEGEDDEVICLSGPNATDVNASKQRVKTSVVGNKEKLCPHHHLHIPVIEDMKIISSFAFDSIFTTKSHLSSPESISFLQQNLDEDLRDDNYRCSICYDMMVSTRQHVFQEVHLLQEIVASLTPSVAPIKQPFYLANQASQLLKRYLSRLEKQQQSNKIMDVSTSKSNKAPPIASPSLPQTIDLVEEESNLVHKDITLKDQKLDTFLASNAEPSKREDISTVRKDVFGDGFIVNENLLCEAHRQPILDLEKKSILISHQTWKLIQQLFPNAIAIPKDMEDSDGNLTLCRECRQAIEKVHSTNEEIKLMKLSEANNEILQRLYKKRGKLQQVTNGGRISIPLDFAKLRQAPLSTEEEQELYALQPFTDEAELSKSTDLVWKYYVIDKNWLDTWRAYVSSSSSASTTKEIKTPALLTNRRLCCPHGKLITAIHLYQECCSDFNYDSILQKYLQDRAKNNASTVLLDDALTSIPFSAIRHIPNLPEVEVVTHEQWKQLVYHHYTYPRHQQGSLSSQNSQRKPEIMVLDDVEDDQATANDESLFEVTLSPEVMDTSISFEKSQWSVHPTICEDCTAKAIEQYYLKQQFYENEGFTTFIIKDPLLMAQLLQSEQDIETLKVIFQDVEAIEEYFQTLIQTMADTATNTNNVASAATGGGEERRTSTRTRANSSRKKLKKGTVWLNAIDTIGFVKLKVFEALDVPYATQQLYCARSITTNHSSSSENSTTGAAAFFVPLIEGNKTLQDYQILARDVLLIVDLRSQEDGKGEEGDVCGYDFLHDYSASVRSKPEEGFMGSIFTSQPVGSVKTSSQDPKQGNQVIELLQEDSQVSVEILNPLQPIVSETTTKTTPEDGDGDVDRPTRRRQQKGYEVTRRRHSRRKDTFEKEEEDEEKLLQRILEQSKTDC